MKSTRSINLLAFITVLGLFLGLIPSADAARIKLLGFETGNTIDLASTAGTFSIQTSTVRTGTYALRTNPTTTGTGSAQTTHFSATTGQMSSINVSQLWIRTYFRYATKPSSGDEEILRFRNSTTIKNSVRINASGNLVIYDSAGAAVATGSTALAADTWYRIETYSLNSTSGAYELKIDGTTELSGSGMNYLANNVNNVMFGKVANFNGNTVDFFYDDISLDNAAYPGAGQIKMAIPNANGAAQTWTIGAGAGAHYENVDEIPSNGNTDYLLSTGTAGDAETEAMQDSGTVGITGTVNSVQAFIYTVRDGASNGNLIIRLRSNTTNSDSSGLAVGVSFTSIGRLSDTDPATGSAWTVSGLDGVEVGAVENSTNLTRMTAVYLMVEYIPAIPGATRASGTIVRGIARLRGLIRFR